MKTNRGPRTFVWLLDDSILTYYPEECINYLPNTSHHGSCLSLFWLTCPSLCKNTSHLSGSGTSQTSTETFVSQLCELRQITWPLWASIFSFVKQIILVLVKQIALVLTSELRSLEKTMHVRGLALDLLDSRNSTNQDFWRTMSFCFIPAF